jgi:hypothetical protein
VWPAVFIKTSEDPMKAFENITNLARAALMRLTTTP